MRSPATSRSTTGRLSAASSAGSARRSGATVSRRDLAQQPLAEEVVARLRNSVAEGEGGSIVDALDFIATAPSGHSQLAEFSEIGIERLRDASRTLAWLRSRAGLDLLDFVTLVE